MPPLSGPVEAGATSELGKVGQGELRLHVLVGRERGRLGETAERDGHSVDGSVSAKGTLVAILPEPLPFSPIEAFVAWQVCWGFRFGQAGDECVSQGWFPDKG